MLPVRCEQFCKGSVWLFGSYATGKADAFSDIDLAVVSDDFTGSRFDDRKSLIKHLLSTSTDIELHPFRTEDFTIEDPFVRIITDTGKKFL